MTYFEPEHSNKRHARTRQNTEVGIRYSRLAQRWALYPLEIQADISEATFVLTIVKGAPARPVVLCRNWR